jgi:hypothetical protein
MKKLLFVFVLLNLSTALHAKKVKFAVDMSGQVINPTGIHVSGDFQTIAGFPGGDWQPNTTSLTNEAGTDIYSIIVDIPAFAKYEYKFLNGDQFYETEFVPVESRVGYNFNDNRWIWVDSLANDTTFVGALLFAGNAPAGLTLVRFMVDMQFQPAVDPAGIHVAGIHQGWDPAKTMMYSFGGGVYEIINYVTLGSYEFKYYNGNISGTEEMVPATCASNTNRSLTVVKDTILEAVCFGSCSVCSISGIAWNTAPADFKLYPNPAVNETILEFNGNAAPESIELRNVLGKTIRTVRSFNGNKVILEKNNLESGIYFLVIKSGTKTRAIKLIFD